MMKTRPSRKSVAGTMNRSATRPASTGEPSRRRTAWNYVIVFGLGAAFTAWILLQIGVNQPAYGPAAAAAENASTPAAAGGAGNADSQTKASIDQLDEYVKWVESMNQRGRRWGSSAPIAQPGIPGMPPQSFGPGSPLPTRQPGTPGLPQPPVGRQPRMP